MSSPKSVRGLLYNSYGSLTSSGPASVHLKSHQSNNKNKTLTSQDEQTKNDEATNKFMVHLALITVQVIYGASCVIGSLGLPSFHPLTFALVRESCATMVLLSAAFLAQGRDFVPRVRDAWAFWVCGCGIFVAQAFYIVGIKLSSAVAASVWQPSQPIMTASICMMLGLEPFSCARMGGILLAFCGCAFMVMNGQHGEDGGSLTKSHIAGHMCFFLNCLGSSVYVLMSKPLLKSGRYESITVIAWSYSIAAVLMAVISGSLSLSETASSFLCPDCESVWHVPASAIPAISFFIVMNSSVAYGLITWANKHATSTLVIAYSVMQPVTSSSLIEILIVSKMYDSCFTHLRRLLSSPCLDPPDFYTAAGALGIIAGLFVIIYTEPQSDEALSLVKSDGTQEQSDALLEQNQIITLEGRDVAGLL